MKVIYVAGPIRAANYFEVEKNIRRAEDMALAVASMGAAVICPHSSARFYEWALPVEEWLHRDLELISRCDAIVVITPYQHSAGTVGEVEFARQNGIRIFFWPEDERYIQEFINSGSVLSC